MDNVAKLGVFLNFTKDYLVKVVSFPESSKRNREPN